MDDTYTLLLFTKFWLLSVLLYSKLGAASNEGGEERKLGVGNPGFISIDCGVEEDYVDGETGIFYQSDRGFISTGENKYISPEYITRNPYFELQMNTMRIFPEGKRNCYTLQPEQGKNHNYLIRAFFKYGDYDAKNQFPKFDLYIGVDFLTTVQPLNSWSWNLQEVIYFSLTDIIYVCLVNTGSGIPYISTLELRLIDNSIYRTKYGSLRTLRRLDLGNSTNLIVRYKDDVYDRVWGPDAMLGGFHNEWVPMNSTSDFHFQGSNNDSYKLPIEVLRTASRPRSGLDNLTYSTIIGTYPAVYMCVFFHFAEIEDTTQGQRREIIVTVNGVRHGPIALEYFQPQTIVADNLPFEETLNFSVNSVDHSVLPPLLNALEAYMTWSSPLPVSPTDPLDVDAIMAVKKAYSISRIDWQGDPCVPSPFSWTGLNCTSKGNTTRIISLNISASKLKGKITSSLSKLTAIQSLDLSHNELTGTVPEFLARLPSLSILNLYGNKFTGSVPQSLMERSNDGILQLSLDGNPDLCRTDSCQKKKQTSLVPIIVPSVSILVFLLVSIIAIIWSRKTFGVVIVHGQESQLKSKNLAFKYSEIVRMTNNFRNIIGGGGFGKVYLGNLNDGTQVAVKLLSQSSKQGDKEFRAEVQLLMIVHHRNLISLIGFCDEHENRALVYEYMENGNLQQHLSETCANSLNWRQRLQIAADAAHGLEYLHNGCKPPIVHRDLKASNILLNEKMEAKISDFGLSRAFVSERDSHVSTHPAGTLGYLCPELRESGNFNKKSDVYSFGILLFELITGKPAIMRGHEHNTHILQWVSALIVGGDIDGIVDPRLTGKFNTNSAWKAVEIAQSCVLPTAIQRPNVSHVLVELKECLAMEISSESKHITEGNMKKLCSSLDVCLELDTDMVPSPR